MNIVFDIIGGFVAVAGIAVLAVTLASSFLPSSLVVLVAIWTTMVALLALPALAMLFFSPPRVPLRERSALMASASWFGRAVWSGAVFALSIGIGSVAGVVASKASEGGEDFSSGLSLALNAVGGLVFLPALLAVVSGAFITMGARWNSDLGAIVAEDGGASLRLLVERRWTGTMERSPRRDDIFGLAVEVGVGGVSRGALVLTLITVGVVAAAMVADWLRFSPVA